MPDLYQESVNSLFINREEVIDMAILHLAEVLGFCFVVACVLIALIPE
jgi:hypothetical protein